MKIETIGGPEDLIKRCNDCDYCKFEVILTEEERKNKVLNEAIPKKHISRITIEQLCGKEHDEACNMKYAAMRCRRLNDDIGTQIGAIDDLKYDLGKVLHKDIGLEEAAKKWIKYSAEIDPELQEPYAKRFREVWNLGQRNGGKQILTIDYIYETVRLKNGDYALAIEHLNHLLRDHKDRDSMCRTG